jgi:hypothetical protein
MGSASGRSPVRTVAAHAVRLWATARGVEPRRDANDPSRRVLLVAHDALMARYLRRLPALLDAPSVSFWMTSPWIHVDAAAARALADASGLPFVGLHQAIARPWDLTVFADHNAAHLFPRAVPKLRINHGLSGGKTVRGQPYDCGPRWTLRRDGGPLYDRIAVSGRWALEAMLALNPALRGTIEIVGDLDADHVDTLAADPTGPRRALGLEPDASVLLAISTWGPGSVLERWGPALERALSCLPPPWRPVLAIHPKAWSTARALGLDRGVVRVLHPDEDWRPWVAVASAGLADHSSLSLQLVRLGRPVVYAPPAERLVPGTVLSAAVDASVRIDRPECLAAALARSAGAVVPAALAAAISDRRGESAEAHRALLRTLLGLDAPESVPG